MRVGFAPRSVEIKPYVPQICVVAVQQQQLLSELCCCWRPTSSHPRRKCSPPLQLLCYTPGSSSSSSSSGAVLARSSPLVLLCVGGQEGLAGLQALLQGCCSAAAQSICVCSTLLQGYNPPLASMQQQLSQLAHQFPRCNILSLSGVGGAAGVL